MYKIMSVCVYAFAIAVLYLAFWVIYFLSVDVWYCVPSVVTLLFLMTLLSITGANLWFKDA